MDKGTRLTLAIALSLGLAFTVSALVKHNNVDSGDVIADQVVVLPSTELTDEVEAIIEHIGNLDSDAIIVNAQFGPLPYLATMQVFEMSSLSSLESEPLFVNVHQFQTLHPEMFEKKVVTLEQAKEYNKESVKMLAHVVNHFRAQGKSVHVLGMSFGSLVTQELIAEYGNIADGYLLISGRLDVPAEVWGAFRDYKFLTIKNGTEVSVDENRPSAMPPEDFRFSEIDNRNSNMLAAGLAHNRYSEKLADADLSNVTFIYATQDEAFGRASDDEVEFLKSRNANVYSYDGGHFDPMISEAINGFGSLGLE